MKFSNVISSVTKQIHGKPCILIVVHKIFLHQMKALLTVDVKHFWSMLMNIFKNPVS